MDLDEVVRGSIEEAGITLPHRLLDWGDGQGIIDLEATDENRMILVMKGFPKQDSRTGLAEFKLDDGIVEMSIDGKSSKFDLGKGLPTKQIGAAVKKSLREMKAI